MTRKFILILLVAGLSARAQGTVSDAGTFLDVGGVKLWYQECGTSNATSVVLLHDGLLHSVTWDGVWRPLCAKYHVVRYDRRGYGRSEPTKVRFVPEDDLAKIMRQVHMDRAIIVGNSSGGGLALDYAIACPQSVSGLVLIGPVVHGMPSTDYFNQRGAKNSAPLEKGDLKTAAENWSKDRFLIAGDAPTARKQLYDALVTNPQNLNYAGGREIRPSPPTSVRLSQIRVPVLILVGETDIADVFAYSGAVLAGARLAKLEVWNNTGHLIQLQRPNGLVDRINRFVALVLRKEIEVPDSKLLGYAGTYTCFERASKVMLMDHQLVFEFPGEPYYWLSAASDEKFFLRTEATDIEFQKDAAGKVSRMVVHNSDGTKFTCSAGAPAS